MRQVFFPFIYLLLIVLFGCSNKYGINKTYAFTRTQTAGNIPVDHQNRPQTSGIKRTYLIYIELKDTISKPQWDTARINDITFIVQPLKIGQDSLRIGNSVNGQTPIILSPKDGYVMWQLLLTPIVSSTQPSDAQDKWISTDVILSGVWSGERVKFRIKEIKELERIIME